MNRRLRRVTDPTGRLQRVAEATLRRFGLSARRLTAASIALLGVLLSSVHLWHIFAHDKPLAAMVVGAAAPLVVAIGIVYAGYLTYRRACTGVCIFHLAAWTYGGAIAMGLMAGLIVLHQYLAGTLIDDTPFLVANAATGGTLGGFVVGIYHGQNRRRAERIETIHEATRALMTVRTKQAVCEHAVEIARDGLDMPLTGVWLYDEGAHRLEPVAWTEEASELFDGHPIYEPDNSISWDVYQDGTPRLIDDVASHQESYNPETPLRTELILPLADHGVFNIGSPQRGAFDDVDVTTAKILASTTLVALERAEREETLREQRERLEQQATQLDGFARTVSHDLRNPLNVASGRLTLAEETGEDAHLEAVEDALARMEEIIDGILWLAREGRQIGDREPVDLGAIARSAWQFVETSDAEIRVDCEATVPADAERLQQLFENLFRNAVEHGGPDVTITVGCLGGGFYVEDDGGGIPPSERDDVFEAGYSTSKTGTGFGLAIVDSIVEAHGWEIAATGGSDGGTRFEISAVDQQTS